MKTLKTLLSGLIASLVLMSTISHSVSFHFCGGEVQNIAILVKAQSCSNHEAGCDCDKDLIHDSIAQKGCCEDANIGVATDKYLTKTIEKLTNGSHVDVTIPIASDQHNSDFLLAEYVSFAKYKPPILERDITLLVQTFLI